MQDIVLHVNGRTHTVHVEPDTPLLYVLRNDLGLKAAKFGCGEGQCGACTVLIDGQPRPSCHVAGGVGAGARDHHAGGPGHGRTRWTPCSRRLSTRGRCSAAFARRA